MTRLPAFSSLLKSREVEDPVNLWVHRPLAYLFVALVHRTPITPNQVTLLAMLVGLTAGACFIAGTPAAMLAGGVLLWSSAILDGADGILARARRSFSPLGRALDGAADSVVAVGTVFPALYHLWVQHHDPAHLWLIPLAIASAVLHIELYDYYKESYLQRTDPSWDGRPERLPDIEARLARLREQGAGLAAIVATHMYIGLVRGQTRVVAATNPAGRRDRVTFAVDERTARSYRRHNRGPMKLWAMISLAPHSYLMSICAMFDRLDIYLWLRVGAANAVFVAVLIWQRIASRRTLQDLEAMGMAPAPDDALAASPAQ